MITPRTVFAMTVVLAGALAGAVFAEDQKTRAEGAIGSTHVVQTPKEIKWGDAPPSLPKGAKLAVIQGDPSAAGEVVAVRLKMPKGYVIPPHFHPTDEAVTVLSGSFAMGMGDNLDRTAAKVLGPGGWAVMPRGEHHWAIATVPTEVQVHMLGPFAITYVNPADDPQAKAGK